MQIIIHPHLGEVFVPMQITVDLKLAVFFVVCRNLLLAVLRVGTFVSTECLHPERVWALVDFWRRLDIYVGI